MAITLIICVALLLGINQIKWWNRWAALMFLSPVVIMDVIGPNIGGECYYFVAAAMDREVLFVLVAAGMFRELSLAAFVAIVLNFFGWGLWVSYQAPDAYNWASTLYYVWVLWILLKESLIYAELDRLVSYIVGAFRICSDALPNMGMACRGVTWKG